MRYDHTASLAEPPAGAFDRGPEQLEEVVAVLAEVSAERTLVGLEAGAERNEIAYFELRDGLRVAVKMCPAPEECGERPYHYYGPMRYSTFRWTSRERVLGLIAEHKRELGA